MSEALDREQRLVAMQREIHLLSRQEEDLNNHLLTATVRKDSLEKRLHGAAARVEDAKNSLMNRSQVAQKDAASVLAFAKQREADRSAVLSPSSTSISPAKRLMNVPLSAGSNTMAAGMHSSAASSSSSPAFPLYSPSQVLSSDELLSRMIAAKRHNSGVGDANTMKSEATAAAAAPISDYEWLFRDAQLRARDDVPLAMRAATGRSALSLIGSNFGRPNSHPEYSNPFDESKVNTSNISTASLGHADAIRRIAALEAEVQTLEHQTATKKAMTEAILADVHRKEEEIRLAQLRATTANDEDETVPLATVATTAADSPLTLNAQLAAFNSKEATKVAMQRSLMASLETGKARATIGTALNTTTTNNTTNNATSFASQQQQGDAPPPPSLMFSTQLDPTYLAELTATVTALEAEATHVASAVAQGRDVEERILQNERAIQQLRKTISDCRLGVWSGIGPDGDGFSGAQLSSSVTAMKGSKGGGGGGDHQRSGDFNAIIEHIVDKNNSAWRDTIRSLYVSTEPLGSSTSSHSGGDGNHNNNRHHADENATKAVTLILCDLEHLSHYLTLSGGLGTMTAEGGVAMALGDGLMGGGGSDTILSSSANDTPFIYLPVAQRVAYFNRRFDGLVGAKTSSAADAAPLLMIDPSLTTEPSSSSSSSRPHHLLPSTTHRYETAACIPKLAEEVFRSGGGDRNQSKEDAAAVAAAINSKGNGGGSASSSANALWGSVAEISPEAYGTCVILLPAGAFGALSRRIRDAEADSSLRTIAVATYGIKSSDVVVVNRAGVGAAGRSPYSDPAFATIATEVSATGYLKSQVIPFITYLISPILLPSSYVDDTAVMVPSVLTVGYTASGGGGGGKGAGSHNSIVHPPSVRASAATILHHFGASVSGPSDLTSASAAATASARQQRIANSTLLNVGSSFLKAGGGWGGRREGGYEIGVNNTVLYDTADGATNGTAAAAGSLIEASANKNTHNTNADASSSNAALHYEQQQQRYQAQMLERQRILDNVLLSTALAHNERVQRASFAVPKDRSAKGAAMRRQLGNGNVGAFSRHSDNHSPSGTNSNGAGWVAHGGGNDGKSAAGPPSSSVPPSVSTMNNPNHYVHTSVATMEALVTAQLKELLKPMRVDGIVRDSTL